jgi:hypothetical protein
MDILTPFSDFSFHFQEGPYRNPSTSGGFRIAKNQFQINLLYQGFNEKAGFRGCGGKEKKRTVLGLFAR